MGTGNGNGGGIIMGALAGLGLAWFVLTKTRLWRTPYMREGKHLTDSELINRYRNMIKAGVLHPDALQVIMDMVLAKATQDSIHVYAHTMMMPQIG
jgi:hypothetical protein